MPYPIIVSSKKCIFTRRWTLQRRWNDDVDESSAASARACAQIQTVVRFTGLQINAYSQRELDVDVKTQMRWFSVYMMHMNRLTVLCRAGWKLCQVHAITWARMSEKCFFFASITLVCLCTFMLCVCLYLFINIVGEAFARKVPSGSLP